MNYHSFFRIISYFFLLSSVAVFVSIFVVNFSGESWYARSPLSPPAGLFAPMWGSLFLLIFLSINELINSKKSLSYCFWLFTAQLILNMVWGVLFSNFKSLLGGALSLLFAWFFVLASLIEFKSVSKTAGYLLLPYLSWVTAAVLVSFSNVFVN